MFDGLVQLLRDPRPTLAAAGLAAAIVALAAPAESASTSAQSPHSCSELTTAGERPTVAFAVTRRDIELPSMPGAVDTEPEGKSALAEGAKGAAGGAMTPFVAGGAGGPVGLGIMLVLGSLMGLAAGLDSATPVHADAGIPSTLLSQRSRLLDEYALPELRRRLGAIVEGTAERCAIALDDQLKGSRQVADVYEQLKGGRAAHLLVFNLTVHYSYEGLMSDVKVVTYEDIETPRVATPIPDTSPIITSTVVQTRVRHILIRTNSATTGQEAMRQIVEIRQRIEGGEDFAALAREFSQDSGSSAAGGDLGWLDPDALYPSLKTTIEKLAEGELSGPVATPYGVHLVQVPARRSVEVEQRDSSTKPASEPERRRVVTMKRQLVKRSTSHAPTRKELERRYYSAVIKLKVNLLCLSGEGCAHSYEPFAYGISPHALKDWKHQHGELLKAQIDQALDSFMNSDELRTQIADGVRLRN